MMVLFGFPHQKFSLIFRSEKSIGIQSLLCQDQLALAAPTELELEQPISSYFLQKSIFLDFALVAPGFQGPEAEKWQSPHDVGPRNRTCLKSEDSIYLSWNFLRKGPKTPKHVLKRIFSDKAFSLHKHFKKRQYMPLSTILGKLYSFIGHQSQVCLQKQNIWIALTSMGILRCKP